MIPFTVINKKEQAINLHQKYFHFYNTYPLLIFYQNQKGTSNKFAPKIFSFVWYLYFTYTSSKPKKEQAINLHQKYFHSYDTYTLLIFHQNQKETSNKFCLGNIFICMIHRHTVIHVITLCILKLLQKSFTSILYCI